MENHDIPIPMLGVERRLLAVSLLEFMRGLDLFVSGSRYLDGMRDESLITSAIVIGQVDKRLVSASDIAQMTGITRPSVARKLRHLSAVKRLRAIRHGSRVCYFFEDVNAPDAIEGVLHRLRLAKKLCTDLSKLDSTLLDRSYANDYQIHRRNGASEKRKRSGGK